MKKTALVFVFILTLFNASDAQGYKWHNGACGVMDINNCTPEEFECLWEQASKNVRIWSITLGAGTTCIVAGVIVMNLSDQSTDYFGFPSTGATVGAMILLGGLFIDCIAIPPSLVWANRKAVLRTTPNYKTLNIESFNISPAIGVNQFNNTYNYGVTLSFTF